jgi:tetratricopeptide (TPR) repeat protein
VGYVVPLGALCVFLSILPAHHNWFTHDESRDYIPRDYAINILAGLEPHAVIFTYGDNDTYPLWYMQNVERFRTDVVVANLSLLNTDWYIKQLRDREPKAPITLTDDEIARLHPVALANGSVAWKNDLLVQHIIQAADWKRPLYFAKTVAQEEWQPYERYLESQGLVMRLVPYQGDRLINGFLMRRNFDEIFKFSGILTKDWRVDNSLYKENDLDVILNNYGVAAAELANTLGKDKDYAGAAQWMEIALRFDSGLKPASIMLGTYYYLNNQRDEAIAQFRKMIQVDPGEAEYWLRLAWIYGEDQPAVALRTIDEAISRIPDGRQLYIDGFRYAAHAGLVDSAKRYIQRWLERHPDDNEMRSAFSDVDSLIRADYGAPAGAR